MRAAGLAAALSIVAGFAHAAAADRLRAGIPEASAFAFAILDAGIDGGFFAKEGLEVERLDFAGGAKEQQAMAAGDIDIAVSTGADLLFVIRGAPERAVAATGGAPVALSIMARPDSGIAALADLRGKTVGTTTAISMTSWVAHRIAQLEGWGPDGVTVVPIGTFSSNLAALTAHDVDTIVGPTATGYRLEREGRARIVVTAGDVIKRFIAYVLYASTPLMQQRPDALRRFLRGWFATIAAMKADKELAIRLTAKDTRLPHDIAARAYDREMPTFPADGHFDRASLAAVKQSLIDLGQVKTMPPDKDLIDESFLP